MAFSRSEPDWLGAKDIVTINRVVVTATGESHALIRPAELESAAARPVNAWEYEDERDILRLGLVLLEGLCRNHPFEQGNKRTALAALLTFCERNRVLLLLPDAEWVAKLILDLVVHDITAEEIEASLRDRAITVPSAP